MAKSIIQTVLFVAVIIIWKLSYVVEIIIRAVSDVAAIIVRVRNFGMSILPRRVIRS